MGKRKKQKIRLSGDDDGMVYSTNADFEYDNDAVDEETLPPSEQYLTVKIDKKQRKGKVVTLIDGFVGNQTDLKALEKQLKTLCGVGGSSKEGVILIQGNFLEKIDDYLKEQGYKTRKR